MNKFKITFSRHAQRRMSLYNITEESVSTLILHAFNASSFSEGRHEAVEAVPGRHRYPVKVVFSYEKDKVIVITAYPLKKGRVE